MPRHDVALVHDWLIGMRGGECVLEVLAGLFPDAQIHTLFHVKGSVSPALEARDIRTSFLQRLPFLRRIYRYALPLFPLAIESLDVSGSRLVISSSHCAAKGARKAAGARHICYCHTPMRYAWDRFDDYFGRGRGSMIPLPVLRWLLGRLRSWDRESARGVDRFLANSHYVADRIQRYYGRQAEVIPPPVDTERFRPADPLPGGGDYLLVSAMVPYKRVDVAVEAFRGGVRRLRAVGSGPCLPALQRSAGPNVTFLGHVDEETLVREYQGCRALVLPGVEDAGIVPLEAMACGRPVIARDEGGVPEVVVAPGAGPNPTGILYDGDDSEELKAALDRFESMETDFNPAALRRHARAYDTTVFRDRLRSALGILAPEELRRATP